jgi:hypothetical protein
MLTRTKNAKRIGKPRMTMSGPWFALLLLVPSVYVALMFNKQVPVYDSGPAKQYPNPQDLQEAPPTLGSANSHKTAPSPPPPPPPPLPLPRQVMASSTSVPESTSSIPESTSSLPESTSYIAKQDTHEADKHLLQNPLWWKTPVGCDFSGFFVELLGYIVELEKRVPSFHLDTGRCSADMLAKVGPIEGEALQRLQSKRPAEYGGSKDSVLVQHMWPRDYQHFSSR